MENPFAILLQVARALEAQRIAYVVVGSVASSFYGLYRTTGDIDIVAEITDQQIAPLVSALQTDFYIDEQAVRRAVAAVEHLRRVDRRAVLLLRRDRRVRRLVHEDVVAAGGELDRVVGCPPVGGVGAP